MTTRMSLMAAVLAGALTLAGCQKNPAEHSYETMETPEAQTELEEATLPVRLADDLERIDTLLGEIDSENGLSEEEVGQYGRLEARAQILEKEIMSMHGEEFDSAAMEQTRWNELKTEAEEIARSLEQLDRQ